MVPKPFPYPLGVGTDICKIHRIAQLLRLRDVRERWVRKIFTRLEWPTIWQRFQRVRLATSNERGTTAVKDYEFFIKKAEDAAMQADAKDASDIWGLPDLSTSASDLRSVGKEPINKIIADERSPLGQLARHLAGRWAAKEAVIKAHSHRRLYTHEVSIITPRFYPAMFSLREALKVKTVALIDPPCNSILMDERVARLRALRGFGPRSQKLRKDNLVTGSGHASRDDQNQEPLYYERRSKVKESERQIAEISISHDGSYAAAVCMALDEPATEASDQFVIDDGEGLPKHEPRWGDEGWFGRDKATDMTEDPTFDAEYYKNAIEDVLKTEKEKIPYLD